MAYGESHGQVTDDVTGPQYTLCSEKNTRSQFLLHFHEWCVDLCKNCTER